VRGSILPEWLIYIERVGWGIEIQVKEIYEIY